MKVICIDATNMQPDPYNAHTVVEGEIYNVLGEGTHLGVDYYLIAVTKTHNYYYSQRRFIPLSGIDEVKVFTSKYARI